MKTPLWIDEREARAIHQRLLVLHGGAPGIRELGLLHSALARPPQHFAYKRKTDIAELAALYTVGIVQNHPFIDGNKRVGFLLGALFLDLNGYDFDAREEEATRAVFALAEGTIGEKEYTGFLRRNAKRRRK